MLAAEAQLHQALLSIMSGKESWECHTSPPALGSLLCLGLIRLFAFCETGAFYTGLGNMGQWRGTPPVCCGILLCVLMQVLLAPRRHCSTAIRQDICHGYRIWAEDGKETAGICVWTMWMTSRCILLCSLFLASVTGWQKLRSLLHLNFSKSSILCSPCSHLTGKESLSCRLTQFGNTVPGISGCP